MKTFTKNGQGIAYIDEKHSEALQAALSVLRTKEVEELANSFDMTLDTRVRISFSTGEIAVAGAAATVMLLAAILAVVEEKESS